MERHAEAGISIGLVTPAEPFVHLRTVLDEELRATTHGRIVLPDAGRDARIAAEAVHGAVLAGIVQGRQC